MSEPLNALRVCLGRKEVYIAFSAISTANKRWKIHQILAISSTSIGQIPYVTICHLQIEEGRKTGKIDLDFIRDHAAEMQKFMAITEREMAADYDPEVVYKT